MRFILSILLGVLAVPGVVHPATIEMDVNGLVCAFCAQGINKTLRGFPATVDVVVSLEKKLVAVSTKEGMDISDDDLKRALTNAGYEVKAIHRESESLDDVRARLKASHD